MNTKTKKPAITVMEKAPHHVSPAKARAVHKLVEASSPLKIEPKYVSVIDAETLTGISRWTWREWAYQGKVASTKVSTRLLIPMSEIERVMTENLRPRAERA